MFNMALLNSGFNIDDPTPFAAKLQKLINTGFGLQRDEPIEEIEIEIDEEEDKPSDDADSKDDEEQEIEIPLGEPTMGEGEPELQEIPLKFEEQHEDL